MQELRPETVDHGDRAIEVRAHEGAGDVRLGQELAREHAPVHDVHAGPIRPKGPPRIRQILGCADDRPQPLLLEVPGEHLELGERREAAPVDDRDRLELPARPASAPQHAELLAADGERPEPVPLLERAHHRQRGEHRRELVVVRHARRRLGVVLHEPDDPVVADEAVQTRRRRGRPEAGIGEGELRLARLEVELAAEVVVAEQRALEAPEGPVEGLRRGRDRVVLRPGDEVRPERDAERPIAEDEPAVALPLRQGRGALGRQVPVLEQLVVLDQRMWCDHRWSLRHGGSATPVA